MPAEVINLCDYRKEKPEGEKSSGEKDRGEVVSLCDRRRLKQSKPAGERLKGMGFPEDLNFGPDEPGEDFGNGLFSGLLGLNLRLDNPNFPHLHPDPPKEKRHWLDKFLKDEETDEG